MAVEVAYVLIEALDWVDGEGRIHRAPAHVLNTMTAERSDSICG